MFSFIVSSDSTALETEQFMRMDALKPMQAGTAADPPSSNSGGTWLDALLPAILPSSLGYDGTGDRAFIRLHPISAGQGWTPSDARFKVRCESNEPGVCCESVGRRWLMKYRRAGVST